MSRQIVGPDGLTDRQRRFAEEYVVDLDPYESAKRAGYSHKSARNRGRENLQLPAVQRAIARAMKERSLRTGINADRVVLELARVGFSDPGEIIDFQGTDLIVKSGRDISESARRAIASVKIRRWRDKEGNLNTETAVTFWDKIAALKSLGLHTGLWGPRGGEGDGTTVNVQVNLDLQKQLDNMSAAQLEELLGYQEQFQKINSPNQSGGLPVPFSGPDRLDEEPARNQGL